MMFRLLPVYGADPRVTAEIVNGIMNGKTNNTGLVTLNTGNAITTTIVNERISRDSLIILVPVSDAAEADTAGTYAVTYDTTDISNGVYLSNSSRINVRNYGIYNIQYSIQFKNTTNDSQYAEVWFRKNGTDVASSSSRFGLSARKSTGDPSHTIAAMNIFLELQVNDYIELAWAVSDTGVSMEHFAASTSPVVRATPSVIATVQYIAPLSYANVYVSAQTTGSATVSHFANNTANKTYGYVIVG